MTKVCVSIALSLDGYMAPEGMTMSEPGHMNWGAKWGALMAWIVGLIRSTTFHFINDGPQCALELALASAHLRYVRP